MKQQLIDWLKKPENANKSVQQIIEKVESLAEDTTVFMGGFYFGSIVAMVLFAIFTWLY